MTLSPQSSIPLEKVRDRKLSNKTEKIFLSLKILEFFALQQNQLSKKICAITGNGAAAKPLFVAKIFPIF